MLLDIKVAIDYRTLSLDVWIQLHWPLSFDSARCKPISRHLFPMLPQHFKQVFQRGLVYTLPGLGAAVGVMWRQHAVVQFAQLAAQWKGFYLKYVESRTGDDPAFQS